MSGFQQAGWEKGAPVFFIIPPQLTLHFFSSTQFGRGGCQLDTGSDIDSGHKPAYRGYGGNVHTQLTGAEAYQQGNIKGGTRHLAANYNRLGSSFRRRDNATDSLDHCGVKCLIPI